jgi:hypothetical protein
MIEYKVNGKYVTIKPSPFSGTQSSEEYEGQIIKALHKIGVHEKYMSIEILKKGVKVTWEINKQQFSFTCKSQETITLNMGAIAQAIQEDIRQIKRGIKDLTLVMKQYQLEGESEIKKRESVLDFKEESKEDNEEEIEESVVFYSQGDARLKITEIKQRYKNFTDLSLIPEKDRDILRKAYLFLGVHVKF